MSDLGKSVAKSLVARNGLRPEVAERLVKAGLSIAAARANTLSPVKLADWLSENRHKAKHWSV